MKRIILVLIVLIVNVTIALSFPHEKFVDPNPSAGNGFGSKVIPLDNGNVIITSPNTRYNGKDNAGAVYMFNGRNGKLLSALYGASANDFIGRDSIVILKNWNYLVISKSWHNGSAVAAGAVTFCNKNISCTQIVGTENSLVGSTTKESDSLKILFLPNGNYVVFNPYASVEGVKEAGAVAFGSCEFGIKGTFNLINSLAGTCAYDRVGSKGVVIVGDSNYVVCSPKWDNGNLVNVGAVTWCNGTNGLSGAINSDNSLIGEALLDMIGNSGITVLNNGNFVFGSMYWQNNNNYGAVTWCDGQKGKTGFLNSKNSFVGTIDGSIGDGGIIELANGNYIILSKAWGNANKTAKGAVTWCSGLSGRVGVISEANSLVGKINDEIANGGITILPNGHYLIFSSQWRNSSDDIAGAITWCNGSQETVGYINETNSLFGKENDSIAIGGITVLSNSNYVINSYKWNNGLDTAAGAVTWGDGAKGTFGLISSENSLVGAKGDCIGSDSIYVLKNGNYVVKSSKWHNDTVANAGAITWCDGSKANAASVSEKNSLVGRSENDRFESIIFLNLNNSNFFLLNRIWSGSTLYRAGALTWCDGFRGINGYISDKNSIIGDYSYNLEPIQNKILTNGDVIFFIPRSQYYWGADSKPELLWCSGSKATTGKLQDMDVFTYELETEFTQSTYLEINEIENGCVMVVCPFQFNIECKGAITFFRNSSEMKGSCSAQNSILSPEHTYLLNWNLYPLKNGNYILHQNFYTYMGEREYFSQTLLNFNQPVFGFVDSTNSFIYNLPYNGNYLNHICNFNDSLYFKVHNYYSPRVELCKTQVDVGICGIPDMLIANNKYVKHYAFVVKDQANPIAYISFPDQDEVFVYPGFEYTNDDTLITNKTKPNLSIFPNPTKDILSFDVKLESESYISAEIYSASGGLVKLLQSQSVLPGNHSFTTDLSDLAIGTYYLRIKIADNEYTEIVNVVR